MYDGYARLIYHYSSVNVCSCRLRLIPVDYYHSARRCAAAAPLYVGPLSNDAVVGTLLELLWCLNISKDHDDPKQLFTTSKLALYHLCSSWFDGF